MRYQICALVLAATIAGCEDKPPAKTVFDPQVQALEKARAVEGKLRDAATRRAEGTESDAK